jgi:hypothetical protein
MPNTTVVGRRSERPPNRSDQGPLDVGLDPTELFEREQSAPEHSAPVHAPPAQVEERAAAIVKEFPCELSESSMRQGWRRSSSPSNTRYFVFEPPQAQPPRRSVIDWLVGFFSPGASRSMRD